MVEGIVGDAALGVACIVAAEAVATAAAGQGMEEIHTFGEFAQAQIEQASAMAIDEDDAEAGKCSQQLGEGLEVEMPIDDELGGAQLRRQIVLTPETLRRAGEYRLGARAVASHAVAAQIMRQAHDAVKIGAGRLNLIFTRAFSFQLAQSFPRQIFGKDRFFLVSFVAGR